MRNLKKLLALVLVAALVFSLALSGFAKNIADYDDAAAAAATLAEYKELEDTYADAVQLMIDLGVIVGTGGNNVDLGKLLSRAEFTVMLYKALNGGVAIETNEPSYALTATPFFTDVPKGNWFFAYANWAGINGISAGVGNGKFGPNDVLTLDQALLLVMKSLGLDTEKEKGFTFTSANVTGLAYQLGLLGDLFAQNEKGQINRATACLLFDYMIFAEQVRYSVITGERYRTGDGTVVGVWGTTNNPSWTLAEKKFGLVMGEFTIISDGKWFALPSIKNVAAANEVNNAALGSGKAIVQRPVDWDDATGDVKDWQTFIVSADDTKAYGFTLEDVGRKVKMVFRKPTNTLRDSIPKLYGNVSYVDDVVELTDIKDGLAKDVSAKAGVTVKDSSADTIFVNYSNNVVAHERARRIGDWGKSYRWASFSASFTYASGSKAGQTFSFDDTAYAAAKAAYIADTTFVKADNKKSGAVTVADLTNDNSTQFNRVDFAIWLNDNLDQFNTGSNFLSGIDWKVTSWALNGSNWTHADIRVIYDGDQITFAFINDYAYAQFDKESSGKISAKGSYRGDNWNGYADIAVGSLGRWNGTIQGVETSKIIGYADAALEKDDYFVYCNIGSTGNWIIKKATDKVTGTVTRIPGGQSTVYVDDAAYKITSMRLLMAEVGYRHQDINGSYGNFDFKWVGQEVVLYMWRGQVMNITGPKGPGTDYCLVIAGQINYNPSLISGGFTYQVDVLFSDNTRKTLTLDKITSSASTDATKNEKSNKTTLSISGANCVVPSNVGDYGVSNATFSSAAGASGSESPKEIHFKGNSTRFSGTNGAYIGGHIFEVASVSSTNISLKETNANATSGQNAFLSADLTNNFVTTRFYTGSTPYNFGVLNGKYILENSVTFIRTANNSYRAYKGQYVPGFNGKSGATAEAVFGNKDLAPTAGGDYAIAGYINTNEGSYVTDLAWCVALEIRDNVWNGTKVVEEIDALTNEGIKTLVSTQKGVFVPNYDTKSDPSNVQRGDYFTYRGSQSAVEAVTIKREFYEVDYVNTSPFGIFIKNPAWSPAHNSYVTASAEFYYVDATSSAKWEKLADASAVKSTVEAIQGASYYKSGVEYKHVALMLVTKRDINGQIEQAVVIKAQTNPGVTPASFAAGFTLSAGQGTIKATLANGNAVFGTTTAHVIAGFTLYNANGDIIPAAHSATLSADGKSVKLYYNGNDIAGGNYTLVLNPAAAGANAFGVDADTRHSNGTIGTTTGITAAGFANAAQAATMDVTFSIGANNSLLNLNLDSASQWAAAVASNGSVTFVSSSLANITGIATAGVTRASNSSLTVQLNERATASGTVTLRFTSAAFQSSSGAALNAASSVSILSTDIRAYAATGSAVASTAKTTAGIAVANSDALIKLTLTGGKFSTAATTSNIKIEDSTAGTKKTVGFTIERVSDTVLNLILNAPANTTTNPSTWTVTVQPIAITRTNTGADTHSVGGVVVTPQTALQKTGITATQYTNTIALTLDTGTFTAFNAANFTVTDDEGAEYTVIAGVRSSANATMTLTLAEQATDTAANFTVDIEAAAVSHTAALTNANITGGTASRVQPKITLTVTIPAAVAADIITISVAGGGGTDDGIDNAADDGDLKVTAGGYNIPVTAAVANEVISITFSSDLTVGAVLTIELTADCFDGTEEILTAADLEIGFDHS